MNLIWFEKQANVSFLQDFVEQVNKFSHQLLFSLFHGLGIELTHLLDAAVFHSPLAEFFKFRIISFWNSHFDPVWAIFHHRCDDSFGCIWKLVLFHCRLLHHICWSPLCCPVSITHILRFLFWAFTFIRIVNFIFRRIDFFSNFLIILFWDRRFQKDPSSLNTGARRKLRKNWFGAKEWRAWSWIFP